MTPAHILTCPTGFTSLCLYLLTTLTVVSTGFSDSLTGGVDVVVKLQTGFLRGKRREGDPRLDGETPEVDHFMGIPYAQPPIGPLRFQAPRAPSPWLGVRNATEFGHVCPQTPFYVYTREHLQNEDCLFLNVFSPFEKRTPHRKYPVMLFIHGGSYNSGGSSMYPGHLIAQHGVVVVTINYRLGVLGYLSSGDEDLPGNYGLLDQILALTWVRNNIGQFRGNQDKVTVFGNSAGGASVGFLMLSPLAKGLFHSAICQSGSPLAFWAHFRSSAHLHNHTRAVARVLGCGQTRMRDVVICLRKMPYQLFVHEGHNFPVITPSGTDFRPWIDGHVLPVSPQMVLNEGDLNNVNVMLGTVKDEWTRNMGWFLNDLFADHAGLDMHFEDGMNRTTFVAAVDHVITTRFGMDQSVAELVKYEYTDWRSPEDPFSNRDQYINFFTDMSMIAPTVEFGEKLVARGMPVHMYTFNHRARHTQPAWYGSYHAIELNFIFGSPFTGENVDEGGRQNYTDEDRQVSKLVMKLWTNFAKYGSPTPEEVQHAADSFLWKPFQPSSGDYLYIDYNNTRMENYLRVDKVALWNKLMVKFSNLLQSGRGNSAFYNQSIILDKMEIWILLSIIAVLTLLVVSLLVLLTCTHTKRKQEWRKNGRIPRKV